MIPVSLLVWHFIGDFLFQTDWMALNKSKRWDALAAHVTIYSIFFLRFGFLFGAITWVTHFLTDALTSRLTTRLWFFRPYGESNMWAYVEGKRHWFFVVIGLDQLIHFLTLWLTWQLLN